MNTHLAALGISSDLITARGLRECEETTALEVAEVGADGRDHLLAPSAAEAWRALKAAALLDGIDLFIVSAFRSIERQAQIVRQKLATGAAVESILTVCAPPGYSEHHTGRALDLSTPGCRALEIEFDQTHAYAWLAGHAAKFGYHLSYPIGNRWGYQYEPWHWCFQDAQLERQTAMYDPRKFKEGATVRICGRPELDAFMATWQHHHPLQPEQLAHAGRTAIVKSAGMYHGGDVVYELEAVPGLWHERHLS